MKVSNSTLETWGKILGAVLVFLVIRYGIQYYNTVPLEPVLIHSTEGAATEAGSEQPDAATEAITTTETVSETAPISEGDSITTTETITDSASLTETTAPTESETLTATEVITDTPLLTTTESITETEPVSTTTGG